MRKRDTAEDVAQQMTQIATYQTKIQPPSLCRCRRSRLIAVGVILALGWAIGLVTVQVMLRGITNSWREEPP